MAKTSSSGLQASLSDRLEKLAFFEAQGSPVVSLYLNLSPDQHGRDNYLSFCRKSFADGLKGFRQHSPQRGSFERDVERIETYLANEVNRSANGLAIFASAGAGELFEAVQLDVPFDEHWIFIGHVPHIYPLARLVDRYPRYASALFDTNRAQIFVFSLGTVETHTPVQGVRTRKHSMGGSSQARYQRHVENFHLHHIKEVVDTLDRIVTADNIQHIIVEGEDVAVPLFKKALPAHLREKVVDVLALDRQAADDDIARATLDALRRKDAEDDSERVAQAIGAWHAGGLGVAGPEETIRALQRGQVEELLIAATPLDLNPVTTLPDDGAPELIAANTSAPRRPDDRLLRLSEQLVSRAQKTGARVRVIEDKELLRDHGGVAALLRFRV
jgi:peptide chain release factor subunit 1